MGSIGTGRATNDWIADHFLTIVSYVMLFIVGVLVRWETLRTYLGHIDDPASLLAIRETAHQGYSLFPSGVLYLQGAVFSYLAAPLAWFLDPDQLFTGARAVNLVASVLVIPLAMALIRVLTENDILTWLVGALIACDPNLILWSVALRPYGILAAEVMGIVLLMALLIRDGIDARAFGLRVTTWIPIVATLGTFTHIGFWLTMPGLVLTAIVMWRRDLLGTHRAVTRAFAISLLPLIVFLLLGRFVGIGSGTGSSELGRSFVGSHLFSITKIITQPHLQWDAWLENFTSGAAHDLIPQLIVGSGVALAIWSLHPSLSPLPAWKRRVVEMVLIVHWGTLFTVIGLMTSNVEARYLNQIIGLGYVILAFALYMLWEMVGPTVTQRQIMRVGLVLLLVVAPVWHGWTAAMARMSEPGGSPDY